jgi:hypothetical protein
MPKILAWFITFNFVNIAWVFFRAKDWNNAMNVLSGMLGLHGIVMPTYFQSYLASFHLEFGKPFVHLHVKEILVLYLFIAFIALVSLKNSNELAKRFQPSYPMAVLLGGITVFILYQLTQESQFLYFNF